MFVPTWTVIILLDLESDEFSQSIIRMSHDSCCGAQEYTRLWALFRLLKRKLNPWEGTTSTCWQRGSSFMLAPTVANVYFYLIIPHLERVLLIKLISRIYQNWACKVWRVHMEAPNNSLWGAFQPEVEPQLQSCGCRPSCSRNLGRHTTFLQAELHWHIHWIHTELLALRYISLQLHSKPLLSRSTLPMPREDQWMTFLLDMHPQMKNYVTLNKRLTTLQLGSNWAPIP